jgi:hypothetical protein
MTTRQVDAGHIIVVGIDIDEAVLSGRDHEQRSRRVLLMHTKAICSTTTYM